MVPVFLLVFAALAAGLAVTVASSHDVSVGTAVVQVGNADAARGTLAMSIHAPGWLPHEMFWSPLMRTPPLPVLMTSYG